MIISLTILGFALSGVAAMPTSYDELIDYVQEAPDQGKTNTCLFMGNTGAMELLANKKAGIKDPRPYGTYDLAESYLIHARSPQKGLSFFDSPIHRFNGEGVHISYWPFDAWINGRTNQSVWRRHPQMSTLPKIDLPEIETMKLFQYGNKWTTRVLTENHINQIKEALWKYKSPVLVNYNDEDYWHVVLIVGYDDHLTGTCYDTSPSDCSGRGAFYVRDSFGQRIELRDYDWFRVKGNAAFVVKLK